MKKKTEAADSAAKTTLNSAALKREAAAADAKAMELQGLADAKGVQEESDAKVGAMKEKLNNEISKQEKSGQAELASAGAQVCVVGSCFLLTSSNDRQKLQRQKRWPAQKPSRMK